jgi:hypothetical protein
MERLKIKSDLKLVLYISHIYDITFYLSLLDKLDYKKYKILFIVNPKLKNQPNVNLKSLNEIGEFAIIPYELKYEKNFFKNIISSIKLKIWINNYIKFSSVLISTDKSQFLSIFLLSNFKKRILIQQVEKIGKEFKFSLKYTLYFNLHHIISGCKIMLYYEIPRSCGQIINLKFLNPIYDDIIYNSSNHEIQSRISLSKLELNKNSNNVIIFGSRYHSWKFVNQIEFKENLFNCFRIIKRIYKSNEFVYIPHPLERGSEYEELNKLFDSNLRLEAHNISSEYYLYKTRNALITFSIGSTSSQSSYNMGFPSKVLYKCLNFDKNVEFAYDQLFLNFPNTFFIKPDSTDSDYLDLSPCEISNSSYLEPLLKLIFKYEV